VKRILAYPSLSIRSRDLKIVRAVDVSEPMTTLERLFVWAGGALFVTALATTGWWYIWQLGRAEGPGGSPLVSSLEDIRLLHICLPPQPLRA